MTSKLAPELHRVVLRAAEGTDLSVKNDTTARRFAATLFVNPRIPIASAAIRV